MKLVFLAILLVQAQAFIPNSNTQSTLNYTPQQLQHFKSHSNEVYTRLYSTQKVCPLSILNSNQSNLSTGPSIANSKPTRYSRTNFHIQRLKSAIDDEIDTADFSESMEDEDEDEEYDEEFTEDEMSDVDTPEPFEYNSKGELYVPGIQRLQRRRSSKYIRKVFRESLVNTSNLIMPLIVHGEATMSDNFITIYSPSDAINKINSAKKVGVTSFLLIPKIAESLKNPSAQEGYNPQGLLPVLISEIKEKVGNVNLIADSGVSHYTIEGHDGLVTSIPGEIDNDATVQQVARQAITLAESGADMLLISDILDGTTAITREILDMEGFTNVGIIANAAKYSSTLLSGSAMANNTNSKVDRMTYLNDTSNSSDVLLKLSELNASDAVVIEPSMMYFDLISKVKKSTNLPVIAYQTPGEVKMIKAAVHSNVVPEKNFVFEFLKSCKRAGADLIITHYAENIANWLSEDLQQNGCLNASLGI